MKTIRVKCIHLSRTVDLLISVNWDVGHIARIAAVAFSLDLAEEYELARVIDEAFVERIEHVSDLVAGREYVLLVNERRF